MNKSNGSVIIVCAPSGSGKTTIVKEVLKSFPQVVFSVSATTRKPRENERDGIDYFFLSEQEFLEKIEKNDFVEWERFYDYYYGTLKSFVEEKLNSGISVLFDVDVKGALNIKKIYPGAASIFIMPPSIEELRNRLMNRGTENQTDLMKRLERAEMELNYKDSFDYCIINDNLSVAIGEVSDIFAKHVN